MMQSLQAFYTNYHQKNGLYRKIISDNNFTYFYIVRALRLPYIGLLEGKKVLDVGCGVGALSLYFAKKGATVTGLDISKRAISIAKYAQKATGLKTVRFLQGELQQGKQAYDMVVCSEIIEHIADDQQFAQLLNSHLKPGGIVLLTTPLSENMLYTLGFYTRFDAQVGHLRRYTKKSITSVLKKNGFTIVYVERIEGPLRNILFVTRLGFLIRFIRGPLVKIFHSFDALLLKIFGASNILVIAKKNA